MRELVNNVLKLDLSNESFLYSCNTPKGKSIQGKNIIKANDICVYNYGFDIMGDSHIKRPLPPSVAHKIAKSKDDLNINLS